MPFSQNYQRNTIIPDYKRVNASPASFENFDRVQFFRDDHKGFQAQILKINGADYVSIGKQWYDESANEFHPTKKAVFMPAEVWREFIKSIPKIQKRLEEMEKLSGEIRLNQSHRTLPVQSSSLERKKECTGKISPGNEVAKKRPLASYSTGPAQEEGEESN